MSQELIDQARAKGIKLKAVEPQTQMEVRLVASLLCDWATGPNPEVGVPTFGSKRHEFVTKDMLVWAKRWGKGFSSCAYLGHWMLEMMGLRFPFVGRSGHQDAPSNPVSRLAFSEYAENVDEDDTLALGDILILGPGGNAHVCVVAFDFGDEIQTWDYGQGSPFEGPGGVDGRLRVRDAEAAHGGRWTEDENGRKRAMLRFLDIWELWGMAEQLELRDECLIPEECYPNWRDRQ